MEETIKKIETLKTLLYREIFPGRTTSHNIYGLTPEDEKEIREKLITLIKSI
jgi:hypothetical protein